MVNTIESILIKAFEGTASLMRGCQKHNRRQDELLIGEASHLYHRNLKEAVYVSIQELLRHLVIIGATGTGKTLLIFSIIIQCIDMGIGFALLDPHGDVTNLILEYIAVSYLSGKDARLRQLLCERLVVIDFTSMDYIPGFNPLEASGTDCFVQALEFRGILKKIKSDDRWGSRMEELMLMICVTLSQCGYTLLEAKKLLSDPLFRKRLVKKLPEGETKEYWLYRYNTLSDRMQAVYGEPILNRLSILLSNPSIRLMVGQIKSTFDIRQIMDQGKWLLVNLQKGILKSTADVIGSFLHTTIQLSALSRANVAENKRRPFLLFADEAQHFVNDDVGTTLSEGRKYGLGLIMAHQFLTQLDRHLRSAVLGNTQTQVLFQLSNQDAATLAAEFGQKDKSIIQRKMTNLRQREAYFKKKGEPARLIKTVYVSPPKCSYDDLMALKKLSMSIHARRRIEVEKEIANRTDQISRRSEVPEGYHKNPDPNEGKFAPSGKFKEFKEW
jgi:hypothetical protein